MRCKAAVWILTAHQLSAAFHAHLVLFSAIFRVYSTSAVRVACLLPIAPAPAAITGNIYILILNASPVPQVAPTA